MCLVGLNIADCLRGSKSKVIRERKIGKQSR
jgi:hypothetical protein